MSRWRRTVVVLVAALVGAVLVGCGISAQGEADRIAPEDVPFGLLEEEVTTTVAVAGRTELVYLVANDRLVPVERTVPADGGLADLLELVLEGPTDVERELGITTAVPSGTVASVDAGRGVAEVDLAAGFGEVRSADQLLALAQVVYTLTGQPGIGAVRFTFEGEGVQGPLGDGTVQTAPLTRDDLEQLAPR